MPSSIHNGWYYDAANGQLEFWYRGTRVGHITASEMQVDQALDIDGASNFAGEAEFADNVHIQSTLEAGADGVGSDGEQLTSGGAAAQIDWAAAASLREFKDLMDERTDTQAVLDMITSTPVYDFHYKEQEPDGPRIVSTGDTATTYTGVVADEAPWAMHYNGRILNPINTFGYMVLAIKGLKEQVAELKEKLGESTN